MGRSVPSGNPADGRAARWLKRGGATLLALAVIALAAILIAAQLGERKLHRSITVDVPAVAVRDDPQGLERGRYLFRSRGCMDCHGADGGGKVVVDDGAGLLVRSPNITPAGVAANYGVADWNRTIRHGVKPDGSDVSRVMPFISLKEMSDTDVRELFLYLRSLPPGGG